MKPCDCQRKRGVERIYNTTLEDEVETGKAREVGKVGLYIYTEMKEKGWSFKKANSV